jgi:hypothetical protein
MSIQHGNRGIVKKDLQLYYNREFSKSFPGQATTNLIGTYSGGSANSYPSSGNSWGTYELRTAYNNGAFFSIGTIASITSNVVTVSSPTSLFNSLATFDVIRPQTTGGGLTANTDYYFKRLSSTTFTLHQYDSTNDGSKTPEQILTYISSDTRISVNATSFPTMWWGYPHLPNVALIKTAITDGFAYDNRLHDCLRLNWFRSDRSDGMAYGVQPTYIANTQYVFTAYIRATSQNAIGGTVAISAYQTGTATYPTITGASSPILTSNWQKWTGTFTSSATGGSFFFYFFPSIATLPATVDIAELQLEQKSYATEFTPTSRSANTVAGGGGLLDISGNNYNIDLSGANVLFDSGGFYFNGNTAGPYINAVSNSTLDSLSNNTHTYECWFKLLGTPPGLYGGYFFGRSGYHEGFVHLKSSPNVVQAITWYSNTTNGALGTTLSLNTWYHGVYVANVEAATRQLYINGSLVDNNTLTSQLRQYTSAYYIGAASVDYASNSIVSTARAYNRALTAAEILQNFNATRKTYGI